MSRRSPPVWRVSQWTLKLDATKEGHRPHLVASFGSLPFDSLHLLVQSLVADPIHQDILFDSPLTRFRENGLGRTVLDQQLNG